MIDRDAAEKRYRETRVLAGGSRSVTKSPYAVRSERKGQLVGLVEFLKQVRTDAQNGAALTDAVADGTLTRDGELSGFEIVRRGGA